MAEIKSDKSKSTLEDVGGALSRTEQFIENNKKRLTYIVGIIVVVVLAYLGYEKFYIAPMEQEANSQMFFAESYFEKDSFRLALEGDGQNLGFLDIIDEYGASSAGNLANYYAGICYLQTGDYESAVDYLEGFSCDDIMVSSMAKGATGDAYLELGNEEKAVSNYLAAANDKPNEFTTPIFLLKVGYLYEKKADYAKALETYQRIQKEYNKSNEGRKMDKYIARVKALMQ
jgi:tetratricopeptide (TPR) repeat protein